jgi:DNA polymerase elongation subunit (family B)
MTDIIKQLITATEGYKSGKKAVVVVEKVFNTKTQESEKNVIFHADPKFHYYVSKEEPEVYATSVPIDSVRRVECKYSKLYESIANETGRRKMYDKIMDGDGNWKKLSKLHFCKSVHSSDENLLDFMMKQYDRENAAHKGVLPLAKAFFDIEVDTYNHEGFPQPDIAPCPINFISYVNREKKSLHLFILLNQENESMMNFIRKNKSESKLKWSNENNEWCEQAVLEHFQDEENPDNSIDHFYITFFKSELNLINSFFRQTHEDKPDFLCAWNAYFDFRTIERRLEILGVDPKDIMCPEEFPIKKVAIKEDTFSNDIADKTDTFDITTWYHCVDLLSSFAGIRKGTGKQDSLKLDDILLQEIGESKFELVGTIQDAVYVDFENFLLYSAFDSYRLNQLEEQNGDLNTLYDMSKLTHTRLSKVMRKTISIRNLAAVHFWNEGLVLSNNQNSFIEHEDYGKFKGAFVADATKVAPVGVMFNGERSTSIFEDTVDEDFTGLYPAIISAFQIGDMPMIGKIITDDAFINEFFGELMNERDIIEIGSSLFKLPTFDELLENLEMFID